MPYTAVMNRVRPSDSARLTWTSVNLKLGPSVFPLLFARMSAPRVPESRPARVVIVAHGLGVSKEVQCPELERLARAGFIAVSLDAPHHGERRDGQLELLDAATGAEHHERLIAMIAEAAAEIPLLIEYFRCTFAARVAMIGISMGGFTTFASFMHEPRPDVAIPFLGSPDWRAPGHPDDVPPAGPVCSPERFFPIPLLAVTAGLDTTVPPAAAVSFLEKLRPLYETKPELLAHIGYPHSEHMMRGDDWDDAWRKAIDFLNIHL